MDSAAKHLCDYVFEGKSEDVILIRALAVCSATILKHRAELVENPALGTLYPSDDVVLEAPSARLAQMHTLLEVVGSRLRQKSPRYRRAISVVNSVEAAELTAFDRSNTVSVLLALLYAAEDTDGTPAAEARALGRAYAAWCEFVPSAKHREDISAFAQQRLQASKLRP